MLHQADILCLLGFLSLLMLVNSISINLDDFRYEIMGKKEYKEQKKDFWEQKNLAALKQKLSTKENKNKAKNIIFFVGDGMSLGTVVTSRIYSWQTQHKTGEEGSLSFENFPYTGLSKTYCVDRQVPDSACTGTAYWSGVKANFGTLGVSANVSFSDRFCGEVNENTTVKTLLDWSQESKKATGIVTNTRVTDGSPAAGYAKIPNRNFEYDANVPLDSNNMTNCIDIAKQLVTNSPGKHINVIMGGGRDYFLLKDSNSVIYPSGKRIDTDLVEAWKAGKNKAHFITSKKELENLNPLETDYVLGLFSKGHMPYEDERTGKTPSLTEMTEAAIKILSNCSDNGFLLFVEGGRIDHAHHETRAMRALTETVEFANAVKLAYENTNPEETLIVVTADHAHTLTFSGYPDRGADILSFARRDSSGTLYTTLSYANGPNQNRAFVKHKTTKYYSGVWNRVETHSGEDVPVYASGPWAHLLTGSFEQTLIPTVMAYASCIGDFAGENCHQKLSKNK
ncbi:alkaline phosphatase [Cimex lectularius]|uniref:Alkaline phosphatase n=1 Tax=Cimex lectularius TaxID=79782 RepID=A0A8I6REF7_CIMLE|nr:alkaline phosphatase [Cimex lectularius]